VDPIVDQVFCTRRAFLRPVVADDVALLYRVETTGLGPNWRLRGQTPDIEHYRQGLFSGVHSQYLIVSRATSQLHGLVRCTSPDLVNGHAQLAAARFDDIGIDRTFAEGFCRFVSLLFNNWPFRKLYLEVAGYNLGQQASGLRRFANHEAVLPDYFQKGVRSFDKHIFAIDRERWFTVRWSSYGTDLETGP